MSRNIFAIDCERVLCRDNQEYLAFVVVVDSGLQVVYSSFVHIPANFVSDLRPNVTGIRQENLETGKPLAVVCEEVKNLLNNSIVVGHSLWHDFDSLGFYPVNPLIRDTQTFPDFQQSTGCRAASLSHVARAVLNYNLNRSRMERGGVHSAAEDATVAMRLYLEVADKWEYLVKRGLYSYSASESRENCGRQASKDLNKVTTGGTSSYGQAEPLGNYYGYDTNDNCYYGGDQLYGRH